MSAALPPSCGVLIGVLKRAEGWNFTNRGITSRFRWFTLVGHVDEREHGPGAREVTPLPPDLRRSTPSEGSPPVVLVVDHDDQIVYVEPAESTVGGYRRAGGRREFGGNYAWSDDDRVECLATDLICHRWYGAFPVHDREM